MNAQQKISILIVDDQRLMREGLRIILDDAADMEVIGEAENGLDATQCAEMQRPDVILMDIRMPLLDGIEATGRILKQASWGPRILLLTTFDTPELVVEGMRAGAAGYLLKDCSAEELCTAVRSVARGQVLLQAASAVRLLAGLHAEDARVVAPVTAENDAVVKMGLTARELEVLRLIARGHSNTEIATTLYVSDATVKTHINHIFSKLGARSLPGHCQSSPAWPDLNHSVDFCGGVGYTQSIRAAAALCVRASREALRHGRDG